MHADEVVNVHLIASPCETLEHVVMLHIAAMLVSKAACRLWKHCHAFGLLQVAQALELLYNFLE